MLFLIYHCLVRSGGIGAGVGPDTGNVIPAVPKKLSRVIL